MSDNKEKYPIKEEWVEYYKTLEAIRRTGATNMWGAAPYLQACYPKMSEKEANEILCNWISNYGELNKMFCWQ
jgi:hypothetical protein